MTQEEHLDAIERHFTKLLEIAKNRTPGAWLVKQRGEHGKGIRIVYQIGERYRGEDVCGGVAEILEYQSSGEPKDRRNQANAAFIAACAGNAEAGWRVALQQIRFLSGMKISFERQSNTMQVGIIDSMLDSIRAAFPIESLTYA